MSRRYSTPTLTMTTRPPTTAQPSSSSSTATTPPAVRQSELSISSPSQPPPPLPAHLSPHAIASIFSVAPPPSYPSYLQQRHSLSSSRSPALPAMPPRLNLHIGEGETGTGTMPYSSSGLAVTPHSRSTHPITPTHTTRPTPLLSAHRQEALLSTLLRMGFSASVSERALEGGGMESVEAAVERALQLVDEDEELHREAHQQEEEEAAADAAGGVSTAEIAESDMKEGEAEEASELPSKQPATTTKLTDSPSARARTANGVTPGISTSSGSSSSSVAVTPPPLPSTAPPSQYQCETCTLLNPIAARRCEACGTRRRLPEAKLHSPRSLPLAYVEPAVEPVQEEQGAAASPSSSSPSLPPNCGICFEHVAAAQLVSSSCGHSFCQECWRGYLTSKVTDGHVLQLSCPFPQCPRSLTTAEVLSLLPRSLHRKYDRFRTNAEIALDPNARWCPTVNCESVMIGSREQPKLRCGKCRRSLCFNCLTGDHRVLTRRGWQSITRVQVGDEVLSFNIASYAMEWKPVLALQCRAVDRTQPAHRLYRMQGSGMDVIATRDHRMLLARRQSGTATGLTLREPVGYETVGELLGLAYRASSTSRVTAFPHSSTRSVVHAGFNTQPGVKVVIPGLEQVCDWWWQQDEQRGFLQFLGFWLADGWLQADQGFVCITEKNEVAKQWLDQLLPRVFPRCWYSNAKLSAPGHVVYIIRCPPLYAYLRLMAVGPLGYNPRDPQQLRSYPHFTKDEGLAAEEQQSGYYMANNSTGYNTTWTEAEMLAAFTSAEKAADPERCWWCRAADWEDGNEMLLCSGEGCQHGGHLQCAGLTAVPEGDWQCPVCSYVVEAEIERAEMAATLAAEEMEGVDGEDDAALSSARRSSVSAATTESSTSQSASDERRFSFSGYSDHRKEKEGKESPARFQPMDSDVPALEEAADDDDEVEVPVVEAVEGDNQAVPPLLVQQMRAARRIVWWNAGLWTVINSNWFYLKRWLGDQQQIANVYSRLSKQQAVALLDGFCRADGPWELIQYDDNGEPTGQWSCSNSSFPLIDQLMLIGQLAGAAVDLQLHSKAGKERTMAGRDAAFSCDHWKLFFSFTRPARIPLLSTPLARPVDVSDDVDGRGYYQYGDDGVVYDITVQDNANFLTQRLSMKRLASTKRCDGDDVLGVRAQPVFVGNCNEAWHEGRSCEEAANGVMAQYKKSHDVKACPQCQTTIERSEGCNQSLAHTRAAPL